MNKQFLKNTKSLCPVCLDEVDAQLFINDEKIFITKECKDHGVCDSIVDPNADLYLQAVSKRKKRYTPYGLVLPITTKCNLNCQWCYLPKEHVQPSIDQIKETVDSCTNRYIVFSGGEPTLRDDLHELIAYVRNKHPNKFSVLLTNGIKLADKTYLKKLKEAGLQYVILSFNGFRKETHQYISNRDLLSIKLKALRNLKQLKLWTILSMTLAKGINEDEFIKVYRFGIRNSNFIRQIRLRNVSEIGVYKEGEHIYLSDMLKIVSGTTGFSINEMCRNNSTANRVFKTGNYFVLDIFEALKRRYKDSRISYLRYWFAVAKLAGLINTFRMLFEPPRPIETRMMFRIEIFAWPTPNNIDLEECRLFCIDHVTNKGEVLPFWGALYRNDRLRVRKKILLEEVLQA